MVGARDTNNEITKKSYTHTFIRKKPKKVWDQTGGYY